ncbi:hypothetical protein RE9431_32050 [Prescottella equi]|nr:hypothetical protein RE9425_32810 [Prescottella equi]BCN64750.1 hypothetical protein RE9431_32050 [Prescottella equi]BCN74598.1 hypothetical protein RE0327_31970 [Prescottella equi]BCN84589.1 hypothetical protein RE0356_32300 [Prescottella equi]
MDCDEKARRSASPSGVTVVRTRSTQAPIRKGITNVQANAAGQPRTGKLRQNSRKMHAISASGEIRMTCRLSAGVWDDGCGGTGC